MKMKSSHWKMYVDNYTVFKKTKPTQHGQMPTNLNKLLYTCRQVNGQTSVKKLSLNYG